MNAKSVNLIPDKAEITALNKTCFCLPLGRKQIDASILSSGNVPEMASLLAERPNLFASTGVFLAASDLDSMIDQIHAIEAATQTVSYQDITLSRADGALANVQPETRGVLMGYDFHVTPDGPLLIEINTNAGGIFLVQALSRAVQGGALPGYLAFGASRFEERIFEMMVSEWRAAGRLGQPQTLAIVDDNPEAQYLYPDMLLAQALLNEQGITTIIVNSASLAIGSRGLMAGDHVIDMVYNRLTDFALATPQSEALRSALLQNQVVVTPSPRHHALYADKRNLAFLSDAAKRKTLNLAPHHAQALTSLPETVEVTPEKADALWAARRDLFFKPATGFGGAAAYRGDKLTRRVWNEILKGGYVAQAFVAPQTRLVATEEGPAVLKFDVRVFTFSGDPLMLAARAYQGQTTNFRTYGGGFAPVILTDA
jgi:hypothetical protein